MLKLIVLAAALAVAGWWLLQGPEPIAPVEQEQVSDVYVAVGFLPWLDAAALRVLPAQTGSWSLRTVLDALGERIDELEG